MRMTDEEFRQELFDRCEKYEIKRKRRHRVILAVCIPLFCAGIITAAFAEPYIAKYACELQTLPPDNSDMYENGYDGAADGLITDGMADSAGNSENAAVYYSDLNLPEGSLNKDVLGLSDSASASIAEFSEAMLSQDKCCMIIEGTVTNLCVKHYTYDIYDDKFEKNGVLHCIADTVVYEIAVDKTWYGDDVRGETIIIEDISYFTDPVLSLRVGKRYVLPLYDCGDSIYSNEDYAGGDITRESRLSTIYPYHPQIEVTNDGSYLISDDWTTLTAKNAVNVIMDTLDVDNYYQDKMRLVDADTFEEQITSLISNIKNETEIY